jgi:hypothetical protein
MRLVQDMTRRKRSLLIRTETRRTPRSSKEPKRPTLRSSRKLYHKIDVKTQILRMKTLYEVLSLERKSSVNCIKQQMIYRMKSNVKNCYNFIMACTIDYGYVE